MVICLFAYGPADVTATLSSLASLQSSTGLTFLVLAYPDCPKKEAITRVYVLIKCYLIDNMGSSENVPFS